MWQRHTQCFAFSATSRRTASGCGSWTMITSQPPLSWRALISLNFS